MRVVFFKNGDWAMVGRWFAVEVVGIGHLEGGGGEGRKHRCSGVVTLEM